MLFRSEARRARLANVYPIGAITKGREGKELAEIGSMKQRGAVAFSDDGVGVGDASVMRKALQYSKMFDAVLMQHCEEPTLSGGSMHAGLVSTTLGLGGIPAEAEQLMIARDLDGRAADRQRHRRHHRAMADNSAPPAPPGNSRPARDALPAPRRPPPPAVARGAR